MTAPTTKWVAAGFQHGQIMVLGADGYPVAASTKTDLYEGLAIERGRELTVTPPDPRTIAHKGDDVVFAIQHLPPDTAVTMAYKTGIDDMALEAALNGTIVTTVGEINILPQLTDRQGRENQVCIIGQQMGQPAGKGAADAGVAGWRQIIVPMAKMIAKPTGMAEANNPYEKNFTVVPTMVTKMPWGRALAEGTDGCLSAFQLQANSFYPLWWANFKGDGATLVFTFNTAYQAVSTTKMAVFVNGVLTTANLTKATDKITFTSTAPADDANIAVIYEVASIP